MKNILASVILMLGVMASFGQNPTLIYSATNQGVQQYPIAQHNGKITLGLNTNGVTAGAVQTWRTNVVSWVVPTVQALLGATSTVSGVSLTTNATTITFATNGLTRTWLIASDTNNLDNATFATNAFLSRLFSDTALGLITLSTNYNSFWGDTRTNYFAGVYYSTNNIRSANLARREFYDANGNLWIDGANKVIRNGSQAIFDVNNDVINNTAGLGTVYPSQGRVTLPNGVTNSVDWFNRYMVGTWWASNGWNVLGDFIVTNAAVAKISTLGNSGDFPGTRTNSVQIGNGDGDHSWIDLIVSNVARGYIHTDNGGNIVIEGTGTGGISFNQSGGSGGITFWNGALGIGGYLNSAGSLKLNGTLTNLGPAVVVGGMTSTTNNSTVYQAGGIFGILRVVTNNCVGSTNYTFYTAGIMTSNVVVGAP